VLRGFFENHKWHDFIDILSALAIDLLSAWLQFLWVCYDIF
jgi:hypothetical protein